MGAGGTGGGGAGAEKVKQATSFAPHFPNSFGSRNISSSFPRTESRVWVLRPKGKRTVETNDDTGTGCTSRRVIGNYYEHSLQLGKLAEDFRIVSKRRRGGYCYTKREVRRKKA